MNPTKRKRITMKLKTPNPLFELWLTEWRDKAFESQSRMQYCFSTALKSLQKYPLPFQTGSACKILTGFGQKLCSMLDEKLKKHKAENGGKIVLPPQFDNDDDVQDEIVKLKQRKTTKRESITREYIPQNRSGAYAILITLYEKNLEPNNPGFLTKKEIIQFAQHLSDKSFTKPDPETVYTAWSSMKTLLEKDLITKKGNPPKFSITDKGISLGEKLYIQRKVEEFQDKDNNEDVAQIPEIEKPAKPSKEKRNKILVGNSKVTSTAISSACSSTKTNTQSFTSFESIIFAPNSFEILLLVDNQELLGNKGNAEDDPILSELQRLNVVFEVRNLKVGDYLWICRDVISKTELVLPYVVERKRMDDFGKSVKDGRFHEQKFRLKRSGATNLIYLVESYGKNAHVGLPLSSLFQAATNTLIQDGFTVKFTTDIRGTCEYLSCMSTLITKLYKNKTIVSCLKEDIKDAVVDDDLISLMYFTEFNKSSSKTKKLKVKDLFVKQLLQIKGVSVDKALAVIEQYQTPKLLKNAYENISPLDGEKLLADILCGSQRKKFGLCLSKTIYQFFCRKFF